jgi:hypothetical protein
LKPDGRLHGKTRTASPPAAQAQNRMDELSNPASEQLSYLRTLNRLLIRPVKALGDAGEPDLACRIAAEAWATLRKESPDEVEQLNGALHYVTHVDWRQRKETHMAKSLGTGCLQLAAGSAPRAHFRYLQHAFRRRRGDTHQRSRPEAALLSISSRAAGTVRMGICRIGS